MAEQAGSYVVSKKGDKPILVHKTKEKGEELPADFQTEKVEKVKKGEK